MEEFSKEKKPEVIETQEKFWDAITDAKNQFIGMSMRYSPDKPEDSEDLKKENLEALMKVNEKIEYLSFADYSLNLKNLAFSKKILENENAKRVIEIYDDLIERVKNFKTKAELGQIMEEYQELLQPFNLQLEK